MITVSQKDAQKVYATLCSMLDKLKWKYAHDDEELWVEMGAKGADLPMPIKISVITDRQVVLFASPLPFNIPREAYNDVSVALHAVNFNMLLGSFVFDMDKGTVAFTAAMPFNGCLLGEEVFYYLLMITCRMADKYNDKLLDLVNQKITLKDFLAFIN